MNQSGKQFEWLKASRFAKHSLSLAIRKASYAVQYSLNKFVNDLCFSAVSSSSQSSYQYLATVTPTELLL